MFIYSCKVSIRTHILNILVFMPFSAVMYSARLGESPRPITSQMGSYVILPECSRSALGCALSRTGPEYVPREGTWRHPDETETTQMLLSFEVLPVTNTPQSVAQVYPDCEDELVIVCEPVWRFVANLVVGLVSDLDLDKILTRV